MVRGELVGRGTAHRGHSGLQPAHGGAWSGCSPYARPLQLRSSLPRSTSVVKGGEISIVLSGEFRIDRDNRHRARLSRR